MKKILMVSVACFMVALVLTGCSKVNLTGSQNVPQGNNVDSPMDGQNPPDGAGGPPLNDGDMPPMDGGAGVPINDGGTSGQM